MPARELALRIQALSLSARGKKVAQFLKNFNGNVTAGSKEATVVEYIMKRLFMLGNKEVRGNVVRYY